MPPARRPARKSVVELAWELMDADARKAKRAKKEPEGAPQPVKKPAKKGRKK